MPVIEGARSRLLQKASALASNDFNGVAAKGDLAVDTSTGTLYVNTGTLAATVWAKVGTQT